MVRRRLNIEDPPANNGRNDSDSGPFYKCSKTQAAVCIFIIVLVGLVFLYVKDYGNKFEWFSSHAYPPPVILFDNVTASESLEQHYKNFSICSDAPPCSTVGKDILAKNGSAVDAAIAAMLCNGIYNIHSTGIGGGFQMVIYDRANESVVVLDARETAPSLANQTMFKNNPNSAKTGALASGVPGELAGYWAAWEKYGKLPWPELFSPALNICETGYKIPLSQHKAFFFNPESFMKDITLAEQFIDLETEEFKDAGTLVKPYHQLCETLRVVASNTPAIFYKGTLGKAFVSDVQEMGGIISMADLKAYSVEWREPVKVTLRGSETVYSTPPPGNGLLLIYILKIMDLYNITPADLSSKSSAVLTWHRLIETFKYAFSMRLKLGDPKFVDVEDIISQFQSLSVAKKTQQLIKENETYSSPKDYGAYFSNKDDAGTAHISILAQNGDAVSVTSTVNLYFGARVTSRKTGILLNSGMDDFSTPGEVNYFNLPPSEKNYIEPRKRSLSSTSPTIVLDKDKNARLIIGASGGTKIPTALAQVILRHLWLEQGIKKAIDAPRLHHQLVPMKVYHENGWLQEIVTGLKNLGHEMVKQSVRECVVCGISKTDNEIISNADYIKKGLADGL